MIVKNVFSQNFWKSKLFYPEKTNLIKEISKRHSKNKKNIPPSWTCDVHTSFFYVKHSSSIEKYAEKAGIPDSFLKSLNDKLEDFYQHINIRECSLSNIWYNSYGLNQYQEIHEHGDALFSGVYYLKFDKNIHTQTTFYDPAFNIDRNTVQNNEEFREIFTREITCEEDDIVIFPGYVKHEIKPQPVEDLRITISFNISLPKDIQPSKNNSLFSFKYE